MDLQTVSREGAGDLMHDGSRQDLGSPQVPPPLFGHAAGQVAGPGGAVLDLAGGGQAEAFFCSLVGLLLRHVVTSGVASNHSPLELSPQWKPRIIGTSLKVRKRERTAIQSIVQEYPVT